jgi:hypothetical protein
LQRTRPFLGKEKLAYDREMATENGTPEAAVEEETSYEKASIACKKGIWNGIGQACEQQGSLMTEYKD